MTSDRPVNEIRPGDRVYLSAGRAKGSVVEVDSTDDEELITTFGYSVWLIDKPLRILHPGDVIPAGAEYGFVASDGAIYEKRNLNHNLAFAGGHCVILSMPTPEPSREEQREKLVQRYREQRDAMSIAMQDWRLAENEDRDLVEAVRVFGEALDALEKFDAEDAS